MTVHEMILILDFGSQYTQLIARRVRELGVFCEIRPCTVDAPEQVGPGVIGLILSGGPSSVYDDDAPPFDAGWLDLGLPTLGICYGMQLLTHHLGGRVEGAERREYGAADIDVLDTDGLFAGWSQDQRHRVWMSHGDHVAQCPPGFKVVASSDNTGIAAFANPESKRFGLQFHPEVAHTPNGEKILEAFVRGECGASSDWTMDSFIEDQVQRIRSTVGDKHVVCGLSGGVDSSVVAALLHKAIGDQLHCIFVDNGLLRAGERESVAAEFREYDLHVIDAVDRFHTALAGVVDPERKRKIIGAEFIRVFEEASKSLGQIDFLAQGTLYPDVIESVSYKGPAVTIKSHHNVGGLPEDMQFELIEPLRELFKDEGRAVGEALGLSPERVWRQPFPGPGLAVRILGEITPERVAILQAADKIVTDEIREAGLERAIWQSFAVLLPVQTVGVMGDQRTYENVAAIRAVHSTDGMTADWVHLPYELLGKMSSRIINEVRGVNRVVYDISSKPPATIEWE